MEKLAKLLPSHRFPDDKRLEKREIVLCQAEKQVHFFPFKALDERIPKSPNFSLQKPFVSTVKQETVICYPSVRYNYRSTEKHKNIVIGNQSHMK